MNYNISSALPVQTGIAHKKIVSATEVVQAAPKATQNNEASPDLYMSGSPASVGYEKNLAASQDIPYQPAKKMQPVSGFDLQHGMSFTEMVDPDTGQVMVKDPHDPAIQAPPLEYPNGTLFNREI